MPKFIPYDHNQSSLIVINYQDQLQPGTFEHAIHHLVDKKLDISIFYPNYQNDETGRPAYDPAVLLKIILFAYSRGITSSREIEWCCQTNIIFKALSCDTVPHFTTIANFVSGHSEEIADLNNRRYLYPFTTCVNCGPRWAITKTFPFTEVINVHQVHDHGFNATYNKTMHCVYSYITNVQSIFIVIVTSTLIA